MDKKTEKLVDELHRDTIKLKIAMKKLESDMSEEQRVHWREYMSKRLREDLMDRINI